MASKRTRKDTGPVPAKKRHIAVNDENLDYTNFADFQGASSTQLISERSIDIDPTLKSGKVKSISLRNFMCHSNFKVTLNNNVNVFVGLNGSGKSAILTAIAIGLGSRAQSTSRSTNLKDLVKRGEQSATIEIVLTNDGIDSFEEDVYGKEITVIRTINGNSGATAYKLKSSTGKVISTSRQDLNKLTLCLNLQVENPVLILNQDAARSFLKEADPKKLYQLFLKATQIEAIIDKLHSCLKCAASSKSQLEYLDRSIKQNEQEIIVVTEKFHKLQSVARLRQDIVGYKSELEWLKVVELERQLEEVVKRVLAKRAQVEKITDLVKNKTKIEKELKAKIIEHGTHFAALKEVIEQKNNVASECRSEHDKKQTEMSEVENQLKNFVSRKTTIDANVETLEKTLEEREKNPLNVENMRRENEAKIEDLNKQLTNVGLYLANARRDHEQFGVTLEKTNEKVERCKGQVKRVSEEINKCDSYINNLKGATKDPLAVYSSNMTKLVKRIEALHKQGKFNELPRGPLGRYIEVTEPSYKQAIENILSPGLLSAFFVSTDRDRLQLVQLFNKEFPEFARTQIITGQFTKRVYDVRNGMVQLNSNEGRVMMDVLHVSDPVVMNCLIDQRHIETVVLVASTEAAIEMTQDEENVPHNLSKVILLKPLSEYFPAPNYRSYGMKDSPSRYIQTNYKDLIANTEAQKKELGAKLQNIRVMIRDEQVTAREQEKQVKAKRAVISELTQKERGFTDSINELKTIEYPTEDDGDVFREELEDLRKKQIVMNKKVEDAEAKLQKVKLEAKDHEIQWHKTRDEARNSQNQLSKIQNIIESAKQQLDEMYSDVKSKQGQLATVKAEEAEHHQRELVLKGKVDAMIETIAGERVAVDPGRSEDVINHSIRSAEKRIKIIESSKERLEDVELQLNNKKQHVEKMIKVREVLDRVLRTLESIRKSRFEYIKRLRQHMSLKCKHKFNVLMGLREYTAEVEISHQDKTLELKVIPRDSHVQGAVSNTKSLSGGERSYSTVAFLIALWSCVEHPFYFLDEYDVFSDAHNRHVMTQLLFDEARKKNDKQFGFLTPQDFSNIQASDTITIHKLQDPDRMN